MVTTVEKAEDIVFYNFPPFDIVTEKSLHLNIDNKPKPNENHRKQNQRTTRPNH